MVDFDSILLYSIQMICIESSYMRIINPENYRYNKRKEYDDGFNGNTYDKNRK